MSTFEGLPKEELGSFEGGSQVGIEQQTESQFDENLVFAIEGLRKKNFFDIPDTINRLSDNKWATHAELLTVINMADYDPRVLDGMVRNAEDSNEVNAMIVAWAQEVEQTHGDTVAIRRADQALADKIKNY